MTPLNELKPTAMIICSSCMQDLLAHVPHELKADNYEFRAASKNSELRGG